MEVEGGAVGTGVLGPDKSMDGLGEGEAREALGSDFRESLSDERSAVVELGDGCIWTLPDLIRPDEERRPSEAESGAWSFRLSLSELQGDAHGFERLESDGARRREGTPARRWGRTVPVEIRGWLEEVSRVEGPELAAED